MRRVWSQSITLSHIARFFLSSKFPQILLEIFCKNICGFSSDLTPQQQQQQQQYISLGLLDFMVIWYQLFTRINNVNASLRSAAKCQ